MSNTKVGIIVGSLREGSYNKMVAKHMSDHLKGRVDTFFIPIADLPLYNEDLDNDNPPESWQQFREKVGDMDAFLFFTPEYNRSMPACLKNALDVASRPYGQNKWNAKPAAVISTSVGGTGAFGANHHFRQCAVFLNLFMMQQPEAYIGNITSSIDENGAFKENTAKFLDSIADSYVDWLAYFIK